MQSAAHNTSLGHNMTPNRAEPDWTGLDRSEPANNRLLGNHIIRRAIENVIKLTGCSFESLSLSYFVCNVCLFQRMNQNAF